MGTKVDNADVLLKTKTLSSTFIGHARLQAIGAPFLCEKIG